MTRFEQPDKPQDRQWPQPEPFHPPSRPGGFYRGSRPDYAPSANPRGFNHEELAALHRMFGIRDGQIPMETPRW